MQVDPDELGSAEVGFAQVDSNEAGFGQIRSYI